MMAILEELKGLKTRVDGERVTFRAQVLRFWEVGGLRMALVGDESALVRVEIGEAVLEERRSYEFREALVKTYRGGWHSLSLTSGSAVVPLVDEIPVSQSEDYIERTYKILAGIQRKKGRAAGRIAPWRHPTSKP
jgi:hypothetical protein